MTRDEVIDIIVREFELEPVNLLGDEHGYWHIPNDTVRAVKGMIRMLYIDRVEPESANDVLYLLDSHHAIVFYTVGDDNITKEWILSRNQYD